MRDKVIRKYGFEARETLLFCKLYEDYEKGILSRREIEQEYEEIMRGRP